MGPLLLPDAGWVRQSFLVQSSQLEKVEQQNRIYSSVNHKFTDTTPGGNFAINPPPQFTRYADIKNVGVFSGNQGANKAAHGASKGMGRYYSEAIDDNAQIIYMRFGVPQFNSMTRFFSGFYDTSAGMLARTGRVNKAFYLLGSAVGFVASILSWKLLAVHLLGQGINFLLAKPSSKFYYLKPTMPLYWNAVTAMLNQLAVNRGIIPRMGGQNGSQQLLNDQYDFGDTGNNGLTGVQAMHNLLPDIFKPNGGIDVYAMAGRAQRLAIQRYKMQQADLSDSAQAQNLDLTQNMDSLSSIVQGINEEILADKKPDFQTYLASWFGAAVSGVAAAVSSATNGVGTPNGPSTQSATNSAQDSGSALSETENLPQGGPDDPAVTGFWNFLKAELDDGSAFASFRVQPTGHVSESFSSQVGESELASKINSTSSSSRSTKFNLSGGNIMDTGIGAVIGGFMGAVENFAAGVAGQVGIGGLAALGGAAMVDIPKTWQSSSASIGRSMSYTIDLVSPYGDPMSQLINIYIPLCMILAGGLPLSTGRQSYTSPFVVEVYDRGRCQTRLGMIDQITVTRGTTNLGFNNAGHAMGVQVTFSITDMSSILHMPIVSGFDLLSAVGTVVGGAVANAGKGTNLENAAAIAGGAIAGAFDEDTVFSDYMAVLSGMGLADQIYQFRKLKLNLTRRMAAWDSWASASHAASWAGDTWPARLWSGLYKGTER